MSIAKLWMGPIHPSFPYLGLNEILLSKYISGDCGSVSAAWLVAFLQQKLWRVAGMAPRLWPCPLGPWLPREAVLARPAPRLCGESPGGHCLLVGPLHLCPTPPASATGADLPPALTPSFAPYPLVTQDLFFLPHHIVCEIRVP